ncbi:MAG: hypothetical protein EOP22_18425 [Hyphomicrobiales bacterium]|nr:MAG: hypothetical protein EOP22_18425 [Hyphomicrobiales bacterium]
MNFSTIGKLAGVLALTVGLAGCVDMTQDLKITSATTALATITTTMSADIYPMIKAGAAGEDADPFCEEEGSTLTENADGSATCVMVSEGNFADLKFDEDDSSSKPTFTANPDGTVRVAVQTEGMIGELGAEQDAQTKAMMQQMFEGRFLTLRFGGSQVIETNMDDVGGGYAEKKMAFLDLINGTIELPEELYAVVRP